MPLKKTYFYSTPELVNGLGDGGELVGGLTPLLPPHVQAVLLLEVMLQLFQHVRLAQQGGALDPVLGGGQISQLALHQEDSTNVQGMYLRSGLRIRSIFLPDPDPAYQNLKSGSGSRS